MADRTQPRANVPLAALTTLQLGGAARSYVHATSIEAVQGALAWAGSRNAPVFVLGGGSNLVMADAGWPGLVIHIALTGVQAAADDGDTLLTAGAGEPWDEVVEYAVKRNFAGIECLSGIPGTVGGTPVQNVGAYGQEIGNVIDYVTAIDRRDGAVTELRGDECAFAYRMSRFKGADADRFIVCAVTLRLRPGEPTISYPDVIAYIKQHEIMTPGVGDVREAILAIRRRKGMVLDDSDPDTRSVGSFFMNPVVTRGVHEALADAVKTDVPAFPAGAEQVKIPAAWLIERAGFARGFIDGAVGLSTKHPLAIVNRGGATARDVVALAVRIKRQVADASGILLRTEPNFVGFGDDADVRYLAH
jgi:UDP-N-acetylmuramate dehydrogenase